jgi:uncharacterized protein YhdP
VGQEFDYRMAVRPGVGQTLHAIGAAIGGPGGAAAGLALQGLLQKSLGNATEAVYTIKGPWSSPEVEPVASNLNEPVESTADPSQEAAGRELNETGGTGNE